jgi:CHAT domain-containing protein
MGPHHPQLARTLENQVLLYKDLKRFSDAAPLADRAVAICERNGPVPVITANAYFLRATVAWNLERTADAVADMKRSMDLAEQQRAHASGGERERAEYFTRFASAFEIMLDWQTRLGDMNEALSTMERSRARSLLDQMETHGLDLLAGVPEKDAAALRKRESQAQSRLASLEKQMQLLDARKDLSPEDRMKQADSLGVQLRKARENYVTAYADIRNASPAYRLAIGQDRKPVAFDRLSKWIADQDALMLEYYLGRDGGYLLVLRAGAAPRLEKLTVDKQQAETLGIEPGPLTAARLSQALSNSKQTGALQLLRQSAKPEQAAAATQKLAALWQLLIPETERTALEEGKLKRLMIIPDGMLSGLPFETLVVRAGENPRYLLDVGPAIEYAPSATILINLADRGETNAAGWPVLTVGDPRYGQPASAEKRGDELADVTPQSRYASLGGKLAALPYTKTEVNWVAQAFDRSGAKVTKLLSDHATEANVRRGASGQKVLHLACHGLVDQAYGNLFGALALTPGPDITNPADDGFLTLGEVYTLNLQGTELAILSACDTNYGPQQQGEGVWALSRGFLVAGSRRVVASNWLVDDEAAATLISHFCGRLANAEKQSAPVDYAESLRLAKRRIRHQEGWESPYYWGTFVLVGPN